MKKPINIVFMGTPDFAVPTLHKLHQNKYRVSLVVTQPDRPRGRGRKIHPPPVKQAALAMGCDIDQPESMNDERLIHKLRELDPDFFIVVAFGHILNREILDIPGMGAINLHASLLPKYRGPAPIQWAVINGDPETGVTTMFMDEGMDTGDILLIARETISRTDTSADLHDRLAVLGADLIKETLDRFLEKRVSPVPQDHTRATYAPMLHKKTGRIDWTMAAENIHSLVRGVTPWPGAFTFHQNNRLKILEAGCLEHETDVPPGQVVPGYPDELRISTGRGLILIHKIQGPSGKKLGIKDFLRGYQISPGDTLN